MAGTVGGQIIRSYKADAVIGAGLAVIAGAAVDSVALPGGANVQALGVTGLGSSAVGAPIPVVEHGEVKAVAGAAIARGALVMINAATGKLAPVGAVAGTNYFAIGIALEAAAADGDEFLMLVNFQRVQG